MLLASVVVVELATLPSRPEAENARAITGTSSKVVARVIGSSFVDR
jgi:hypothetical protein